MAHRTRLIKSPREWRDLLEELSEQHVISFDTEYENRGYPRVKICGFSIAWRRSQYDFHSIYVPINHTTEISAPLPNKPEHTEWRRLEWQLPVEHVRSGLKKLMNSDKLIVMHNAQADLKILHVMGVKTPRIRLFDTMIASWLILTDRKHGLKPLTKEIFGYTMTELSTLAPEEYFEDRSRPRLKTGKRKGLFRLKKSGIRLVARVGMNEILKYAGEDAYYTLRLYIGFRKKLKREKMYRLFNELLMEDVLYINEMEETGMVIDHVYMKKFVKRLNRRIAKRKARIFNMRPGKMRGVEFNIGSAPQLNLVLFGCVAETLWYHRETKRGRRWRDTPPERYDLMTAPQRKVFRTKYSRKKEEFYPERCEFHVEPIGDPGKSGNYSVSADNLKKFAFDGHRVCKLISTMNGMSHLVGMVEGWLKRAVHCKDGTWRLFGSFNMHGTRTGRLSSSEPNLQNIPVRDPKYPIREAFICPKNMKFVDADYSQIELKLLAHFSGDKRMIRVFEANGDLHAEMAIEAYKLKPPKGMSLPEQGKWVKKNHPDKRARAKTINFATIYGAGPVKLAIKNDIPLPEAKKIHSAHPRTFPGAHRWMKHMRQFSTKHGFVRTLFKRKRLLPNAQINPYDFQRGDPRQHQAFIDQSAAHRRAINTPIQGSAADMLLLAMRNIRRHWMKEGVWLKEIFPTCQVHDELVFYITTNRAQKYLDTNIAIMKKVFRLTVPVEADGSIGDNWREAK